MAASRPLNQMPGMLSACWIDGIDAAKKLDEDRSSV
jgi:hypothetical protein